jgi:TetR/AcrR family transcriptional repressor of lmrAB and yxaGH operons
MSTQPSSKERMLEATASLLQRQGYYATGLNQIVREASAPKGSLYFHFPGGKEELAAAALKQAGDKTRADILQVIADNPAPPDAVHAVALWLGEQLSSSNFEAGCPVATVALEAASSSARLQEVCSAHYQTWHGAMREYLVAHGMDEAEADATATLALAAIEGALLLARAQQDPAPLCQVGAQLRDLVAARL